MMTWGGQEPWPLFHIVVLLAPLAACAYRARSQPIRIPFHHAYHPYAPSDSPGTRRRSRAGSHFTQAAAGRNGRGDRARYGRHRLQARDRIREPAGPPRRIAFDRICTGTGTAGGTCRALATYETLGGNGIRVDRLRFTSLARHADDWRPWCRNLVALL